MNEPGLPFSFDTVRGGLQSVLEVEGDLKSITRIPGKFKSDYKAKPDDQLEVRLSDAVILKMEEGVPEPELRDEEFVFWVPFAQPGVLNASDNSTYGKGFGGSGKKLGILPDKKKNPDGEVAWGRRVVIKREDVFIFKKPTSKVDDNGEKIYDEVWVNTWVFGEQGEERAEDLTDYARKLVAGKNDTTALRAVMMDNRTKHNKELVAAARAKTLGEHLGMVVDDAGLLQLPEKEEQDGG